jgi:hypothetical protein
MGRRVSDFLCALLSPIFWASINGVVAWKILGKAEGKRAFLRQWRWNNTWTVAVAVIFRDGNLLRGAAISIALSMLFDDDLRNQGKKAAKQFGDKTRKILEKLREGATPRGLRPLPGLSAFG